MNRMLFTITAMAVSAIIFYGCGTDPTLSQPTPHTAPDSAAYLDASNFDSLVMDSGTVAIVEFYSGHCSVCGPMMWIIDSLAKTLGDSALVGAVNTDADDTLWRRFSVATVPSYLLFNNGVLAATRSYLSPDSAAYDTLLALVKELIAGNAVIDTPDTNQPPDTIPAEIVMLDSANFSAMTAVPGRVSMVEFGSPTCGACQMMDSVVTELGARYAGTALIGRVNGLEDHALHYSFTIEWWPTYVFLVCGTEVRRVIGVTPEDSLAAIIDRLLLDTISPGIVMLDSVNFGTMTAVPGRVAMVDFFSPMCGACQMIDTVVEALAVQYAGRALIAKVDVLENYALFSSFNIDWLPSLIFFVDGNEVRRVAGVAPDGVFPQDSLAAILDSLLVSTQVP